MFRKDEHAGALTRGGRARCCGRVLCCSIILIILILVGIVAAFFRTSSSSSRPPFVPFAHALAVDGANWLHLRAVRSLGSTSRRQLPGHRGTVVGQRGFGSERWLQHQRPSQGVFGVPLSTSTQSLTTRILPQINVINPNCSLTLG